MKEHTITEKDFIFFQETVRFWINELNLNSVEISCDLKDLKEKVYASTNYNYPQKIGLISLNKTFRYAKSESIKNLLKDTALHEVLEVLLCELNMLAESRTYDETEVERATHAIIHRLINCLMKNKKRRVTPAFSE